MYQYCDTWYDEWFRKLVKPFYKATRKEWLETTSNPCYKPLFGPALEDGTWLAPKPCGYCGSTEGFDRNEEGWLACRNCQGV